MSVYVLLQLLVVPKLIWKLTKNCNYLQALIESGLQPQISPSMRPQSNSCS